jgi:hypothetical protein
METREFDARCFIAKVHDGDVRGNFAVDRQGNLVRFALLDLVPADDGRRLERGRKPKQRLTTVLEREQEIETRVSEAARILVEHAPQVLDGDVAVFHRR